MSEATRTKVAISNSAHNFWRRLDESQGRKGALGPRVPFLIVVDANAAIGDVIWMARRKWPEAATPLRTAVADRNVVAFAPPVIRDEVRRHLASIGQQLLKGTKGRESDSVAAPSLERLEHEWAGLQKLLTFVNPGESASPSEVVDPDDLPYVALYQELTADAVLTRDRHIARMGGEMVAPESVIDWRDYGAAASEAYTLRQGAVGGTFLAAIAAVGVGRLASDLWRRLPPWMKIAVVAGSLFGAKRLLEHKAVLDEQHSTPDLPSVGDVFLQLVDRHEKATKAMRAADKRISIQTRPRSVKGAAIASLAMEARPLGIAELLNRMEALGVPSGEVPDEASIARLLASSPDFIASEEGKWALSAARVATAP